VFLRTQSPDLAFLQTYRYFCRAALAIFAKIQSTNVDTLDTVTY